MGQGPNQPAGTPDRRRRRGAKSKGPRKRTWRPSVLRPKGENKPAGTRSWRRQHGAQSEGPRQRTWRPSVWAKSLINRPEPRAANSGTGRNRRVRASGPGGRAFGPRAQSTGRNPGPLTAARGAIGGSAPADLEAERLGQEPNQPAGTPDRRRRHGAKSKGPRKRTWRPSVWAKGPISRPEPRTVEGGTGRSRRVRVSGPGGRAFCARRAKISRPEPRTVEGGTGRSRRVRASGPGGRAFGPRAQ